MSTNLSNWREPDHNIWAFQNIDKIIKTESIARGSKTSPLETRLRQFEDFRTYSSYKLLDLPAFLEATETDGLVVLKDGEIVFEHYGRTNHEQSIHIMMSMTKSVTGLVSGILAGKGKLDVNALVATYVPEVKGTSYESVTVRQCLDMRSGVKFDDTSPGYRSAAGWNEVGPDEKPTNLHEFISQFHAPLAPVVDGLEGGPFEYVSVNTDLMGWVLERASGKKFAELVSELIWQPMGAESDAYVTVDRDGNARAAGGMCATTRDIARLGQLLLHDDNGVIPASWIHDMLEHGSKEAFAAGAWKGIFEGQFDGIAYRSFVTVDQDDEVLMGIGIHGQMLFADRKNGIVMAKTSSQPQRFDAEKAVLTMKAFKEFRRILTK